MIIKRIPMNALLKAVFAILTEKQSTPVYDEVPETAVAPYITLGAFTSKSIGNKLADLSDISLAIHIWSEYNGKAEVKEIADDITAVLTTWKLLLQQQ